MFQKRIRPIFFRAKKMWGFIVIHHYLGQKGWKMILSSWRFFHVKLWPACARVLLYFFDRFLLWKVNGSTPHWYPIVCFCLVGNFFQNWVWIFLGDGTSSGVYFPGKKKKIEKFRNDMNPKLFHMKNDNTRISGLHRNFTFSGKIIALIPVIF